MDSSIILEVEFIGIDDQFYINRRGIKCQTDVLGFMAFAFFCVQRTGRNSWQHPWAIVVSRRLRLWSQVCIYESIHWAWFLPVKLSTT